jgi:purine-binding chemotaxis protein CheW
LPRAPDLVEGVIDVHGTLTPVFDLRRRFGRAPQPLRESEHLIVASNGDRLVAFRVDEALDLVDAGTSVDQLPPFADGPAGEGIVRLPDGAVAIYDLPTFLSAAERVALEEALRS